MGLPGKIWGSLAYPLPHLSQNSCLTHIAYTIKGEVCTGLAGGGVSGVVIPKAQKVGILPHVSVSCWKPQGCRSFSTCYRHCERLESQRKGRGGMGGGCPESRNEDKRKSSTRLGGVGVAHSV